MLNTTFEAYKIRREIVRSGTTLTFKRCGRNAYGEIDIANPKRIGEVEGLYHETNSHVNVTANDATQVRSKKVPMVMCLYEDVEPLKLRVGDYTCLNGKTFLITGIVNIQEWNIAVDISLEVVDNNGIPA